MAIQKTPRNAITDNAITSAKIEDGAITAVKIDPSANITNTKAALTATQPTYSSLTPSIADPGSATAITITGANFITMPSVDFINSTGGIVKASVVSFTSSTQIVATFPSGQTAGTYKVRIENPKGFACLSTDTITNSIAPLWSTNAGSLATVEEGDAVSVYVLALDDDSTAVSTYAITSGALPSGVTLNTTTGLISGTAPQVDANTTYNFGIQATDDESQQTTREFSITVEDFSITNSCRFMTDTVMKRTNSATSTNRQQGCFSTWIKKCNVSGTGGGIITGYVNASNFTVIYFDSDHRLCFLEYQGGSSAGFLRVPNIFKDPSAWYHIAYLIDTTQATADDRVKVYVNGTQITSFHSGGTTQPDQNNTLNIFTASTSLDVGQDTSGSPHFMNGYLAETVLIDGTTKVIGDFGEFDSDSPTIWKPKSVSGLSGDKGVNGFYLDYKDSANLGNCAYSGTDLTETNLTATDQATDNPTNNFATLNPLLKGSGTYSEGNLGWAGDSNWRTALSTIAVAKGKWYAEFKWSSGDYKYIGIQGIETASQATDTTDAIGNKTPSISHPQSGVKFINGTSTSYGNAYDATSGLIIGVAMDLDNHFLYFSHNGAWENSGDPESGATGTGAITIATEDTSYLFGCADYNGLEYANFGSPPYANTSDAADANGYGAFEYSPPTGYFALCTKNLAEYG